MQLVQFTHAGTLKVGVQQDDGIIDLTSHGFAGTMEDLITAWPQLHVGLRDLTTQRHPTVLERATLTLQAPVLRPSKMLAVGMNYADHCREQGIAPPKEPLVFAKVPSTIIGPGASITWDPALTNAVDYEVELAVVIGQRARHLSVANALGVIFGYTIANDISARDLQQRDGQWTRAKNFDTFCPLGPTLLTADEVPDPQDIPLTCQVNDAVMQASTTHEMIFSVAEILVHLSRFVTLEPGDLVLTGTPRGVGAFRQPPISLQPGDQVQCTIPGIGTLTNPVVAWAPPHQEG